MLNLTHKELVYLRRLTRSGIANFVDKSHWHDLLFQKLRSKGLVAWVKPSLRPRQVEITTAGREALTQ